jgi:hypothetical protein
MVSRHKETDGSRQGFLKKNTTLFQGEDFISKTGQAQFQRSADLACCNGRGLSLLWQQAETNAV